MILQFCLKQSLKLRNKRFEIEIEVLKIIEISIENTQNPHQHKTIMNPFLLFNISF